MPQLWVVEGEFNPSTTVPALNYNAGYEINMRRCESLSNGYCLDDLLHIRPFTMRELESKLQ
jgi:hypothetical protein